MELHNKALKMSKPTKELVLSILENLYEKSDHRNEIATIYRHYIAGIKHSKKVKTNFEWVARAVGTNPSRPQLHYVYADGEYIAATNGDRLHWCPDIRPEGFYCSKTEKKLDVDYIFPDWKRIIPSPDDCRSITISTDEVFVGRGKIQCVKIDDFHSVNLKYLSDVLNGKKEHAFDYDGHTRLTFCDEITGRNAVIMTIRK